jgi:hypothetical protein
MLAAQQAEMNRDAKKRRKPFDLNDFYLYVDSNTSDMPDGIYGAAAKRLIELGKYPSWALFVYNDLKVNAKNCKAPSDDDLVLMNDTAVILAPKVIDGTCHGMLLALRDASNRILEFSDITGENTMILRMPSIEGQVTANEDAQLRIIA